LSSKYVFKFGPEFLNEHRRLADTNINAVLCARQACNQPFEKGQWIFSKPARPGKQKRYHLSCALKMILITRAEVKKYRNVAFFVALAMWATEIGRQLLISG